MTILSQYALSVILLSVVALDSFNQIVTINPDKSLEEQFSISHTTYVINKKVDLKGKILSIPLESRLLFKKKGRLSNGSITFNETCIDYSRKRQRFESCKLSGTLVNKEIYVSVMGVVANGTFDDAPLLNQILKCVAGRGCTVIFDCNGDYGIGEINKAASRNTLIVGSETTILFTGKGFLRANLHTKGGQVILLKNVNNVNIINPRIDGGGRAVITGASGENGIGVVGCTNILVEGGVIKNCFKGNDVVEEEIKVYGDGGKGVQVENGDVHNCIIRKISIFDCNKAISCHRSFDSNGGIDVIFSEVYAKRCGQFAIVHQTNGESKERADQNVVIKKCIIDNCGFEDGVFILSRTRYLTVDSCTVIGSLKVPAVFRGRASKSVITNVIVEQPCEKVIDMNPSPYGQDQRKTEFNYYDLIVKGECDYFIGSDEALKVPNRSMTNCLVRIQSSSEPKKALYTGQVINSEKLNFDFTYSGKHVEGRAVAIANNKNEYMATRGKERPTLHSRDAGYAFWDELEKRMVVWNGNSWESVE